MKREEGLTYCFWFEDRGSHKECNAGGLEERREVPGRQPVSEEWDLSPTTARN